MDPQDAKDFLTIHAQKNTTVTQVREALMRVFTRLGGEQFIYDWARKSPKNMEVYLKLLAQLMPKEHKVGGDAENPLRLAAAHPIDPDKYRLKAAGSIPAALTAPILDADTDGEDE